jgi:hypothetical protein
MGLDGQVPMPLWPLAVERWILPNWRILNIGFRDRTAQEQASRLNYNTFLSIKRLFDSVVASPIFLRGGEEPNNRVGVSRGVAGAAAEGRIPGCSFQDWQPQQRLNHIHMIPYDGPRAG